MLKNMLEKLARLAVNKVVFDPSCFNDPLAMQTEWKPAKGGGANFRTHKLFIDEARGRAEFRPTLACRLFSGFFIVTGLGIASGMALSDSVERSELWIPLLFGLLFAAAGWAMWYFMSTPVVFDSRTGSFWKSRRSPQQTFNRENLPHAELDRIHALQIVSEWCRGNKTSYHSYELNLVLDDASRINIIDHGNIRRLREDAGQLAAFLKKPLWDATSTSETGVFP